MPYRQRLDELLHAIESSVNHQNAAVKAINRAPVLSTGRINPTAVAFNVFEKLLHSEGLRPALYSVLRRSDYRFISIFRFKNGMATSAVHVDREDLSVTQASEVPDTATYCHYVRESKRPFITTDAAVDQRTGAHPSREVVRSYCGLPLYEEDGTLIGVLCLHDRVPRQPDHLDLDLLLQVCLTVSGSGLVPPYPVE